MKLIVALIIIVCVGDSIQDPVKSRQKEKGKQVINAQRKPLKPRYEAPPPEEVYKQSAWELMKYKPAKPNKIFAKLFANHPQIKALDLVKYKEEPLLLAKEIEKLRPTDAKPQKAFTATMTTYLKSKNIDQGMIGTISGHHKRARSLYYSQNSYKKKLALEDDETAAKRRRKDALRKRIENRKESSSSQIGKTDPYFNNLLAKHGLDKGGLLSATDLAKHSDILLQDQTKSQGTLILKNYMKDHFYKESDIEQVMAIRANQAIKRANEKRKESNYKNRAERGSISKASISMHSSSASQFHNLEQPVTSSLHHDNNPETSHGSAIPDYVDPLPFPSSPSSMDEDEWYRSLFV